MVYQVGFPESHLYNLIEDRHPEYSLLIVVVLDIKETRQFVVVVQLIYEELRMISNFLILLEISVQ